MGRTPAAGAVLIAVLALPLAAGEGGPEPRRSLDEAALGRIEAPPPGLPPVPVPAGNPPTVEKIRLGRKLFLDRRLSFNGTLSCAICHVPEQGFTSNELRTAVGIGGVSLGRSAPTLVNVAYAAPFFHDGREPELDLQPLDVFLSPEEMAAPSAGWLVERVRSLPDYDGTFEEAFGGPATLERAGQALGTYLRTLLAGGSPFDRWYFGGDEEALTEAAKRGFRLFTGAAGCFRCHPVAGDGAPGSTLLTDGGFHDTGIGWHASTVEARSEEPVRVELAPGLVADIDRALVRSVGKPRPPDLGRFEVTLDPDDRWRFKTPSLRNVALTAPYMHDGSLSTLREVVELYDRGGIPHDGLDPLLEPLGLTEGEVDDLVAFLESLTGDGIDELVSDARSERVGNVGDGRPEPTEGRRD